MPPARGVAARAVPRRESVVPPLSAGLDSPATLIALAAYGVCPARAACLTYAVAAGEREGVWGATLPDVRR
jgi:hypothetical protein